MEHLANGFDWDVHYTVSEQDSYFFNQIQVHQDLMLL